MAAPRSRGLSTTPTAKPRSDVYTGLLVLSLVGMIGASVLLWLDYSQYSGKTPPKAPSAPLVQPGGGGGAGK
jgi:hypothetical protein